MMGVAALSVLVCSGEQDEGCAQSGQLKLNYNIPTTSLMEYLTFETEITDEYLIFLKSEISI